MTQWVTTMGMGLVALPPKHLETFEVGTQVPEFSATCPQCDTTFRTREIRECLFCGYKEGREIDQDKALRYKMPYRDWEGE